mmetsp:Transcript_42100/g.82827  ORF Transcript_42100/g.82827 Transcript_42100/m.82827 type:complete len:229 (-) Transcript_42100:652-1338(-)
MHAPSEDHGAAAISISFWFEEGVERVVEELHHREGAAEDGEEGGEVVVKVPSFLLHHHGHGRDVVNELGFGDVLLLVGHHLVGGEDLVRHHLPRPPPPELVVRGHDLQVVVVRRVLFLHRKTLVIQRRKFGRQAHPIQALNVVALRLREVVAKAQVVHRVAQVRGRRVQVVALRPRLDVEVSGHAVDQQKPDEHASRVVRVPVGRVRLARLRPLPVLRLELQLALGKL